MVKRHIVFVLIVIAILVGVFFMNKQESSDHLVEADFAQSIQLEEEENDIIEDEKLIVDIKGEVEKPGVYEMNHDARVADVVTIAGGFTTNADEKQINLAQKVIDEMVIIVPKEGEQLTNVLSPISNGPANGSNDSEKVRINSATKDEIETLNGIGPKKAQAIIDYREENGPFQTVEDLTNVSGIGEKTVENIRDSVIIP